MGKQKAKGKGSGSKKGDPMSLLTMALAKSSISMRPIDLFRTIDSDRSGKISKDELALGFKRLGVARGISDTELKQLVEAFDTDGDGQINLSEMKGTTRRMSLLPLSIQDDGGGDHAHADGSLKHKLVEKRKAQWGQLKNTVAFTTGVTGMKTKLTSEELALKEKMLKAMHGGGVQAHKKESINIAGFEAVDNEVDHRAQGDMTLYTVANLRARMALRNNEDVLCAMKKFWVIKGLKREMNAPKFCSACSRPGEEHARWCVKKESYTQMMTRFFKLLVEDEEAALMIEDDWDQDIKGDVHGVMTEETFYDSLFELVDTWCVVIDAKEYVWWLNKLHKSTVITGQGRPKWRMVKNIKYDASFDEPSDMELEFNSKVHAEDERMKSEKANEMSSQCLSQFVDLQVSALTRNSTKSRLAQNRNNKRFQSMVMKNFKQLDGVNQRDLFNTGWLDTLRNLQLLEQTLKAQQQQKKNGQGGDMSNTQRWSKARNRYQAVQLMHASLMHGSIASEQVSVVVEQYLIQV
jgi:hypothetical protein